jgi:ubiquinone/menaquinone biosynthesis C-methylase UbiE
VKLVKNLNKIIEQTKNHYDRVAYKYVDLFKNEIDNKGYDRKLLDDFADSLSKNSLVCDVGCGATGHIGRYLFNKGFKVHGIDISEKSIGAAKAINPEMKFSVMDMCNLQFPDESFDGMVGFYSIIHIPKDYIKLAFKEFNRVLKKDGMLLLAVHKGDSEEVLNEALWEKASLFISKFKEIELIENMTKSGFGIKFIETRQPYEFEVKTERIYALGVKL